MSDEPDSPLNLPILPTYSEGTYILLLPGLDKNRLKDWTYEYDENEKLLKVNCYYGGLNSEGQIDGVTYPIEVTEEKEDIIEEMNTLLVQNPLQVDLEEYFDPEQADELRRFFKQLENKYSNRN